MKDLRIESVWWDERHECNVIALPMPGKVPGQVALADDGSYVMFLNSGKCDEQKHKTYDHECYHIEQDELYSDEDVQTIESRTHRKVG